MERLASEPVEGSSLPLQGIHDVECSHRLATGVLGVGDCIADDVLKKDLEDSTSLLL
jgi:hypothetical protein